MSSSAPLTADNASSAFHRAFATISVLPIDQIGREFARFGLALVVLWIGGMKFTSYEAEGIRPFVENSPLMFFVYEFISVSGFSSILGLVEITVAVLIAARYVSPQLSLLGGLLATGMFATTLSFVVTTPGAFEASLGGFPALSITGQFLLKDIVLLGAALWSAGDSLKALR